MKNLIIFFVFIAITSIYSSVLTASEWTFMVYLDGDNDLEVEAITDFMEMASVGSDENLNIVVLFDRIPGYTSLYGDWNETRRGIINAADVPDPDWGESIGEANMGDPATLTGFIDWAIENYPANKYALILWDHGDGWRNNNVNGKKVTTKMIALDETNGNDWLYTNELSIALENMSPPTTIDVIGFDACLMAMLEIAYEIRNGGLVIVGAEMLESSTGWPYNTILSDLKANPVTTDAAGLGSIIVQKYGEYYGTSESQSAVDLTQIGALGVSLSTFAETVMAENNDWFSLDLARSNAALFEYDNYRDLGGFIDSVVAITENGNILTSAQNVQSLYQSIVIANSGPEGTTGLSIYFEENGGVVDPDYIPSVIDFANTLWDEFLAMFVAADISFGLEGYELIYRTGFDEGLPSGWAIVDGSNDEKTWSSNNPSGYTSSAWTGTFMIVDSDFAGLFDMDEELISHLIDCSDYAEVILTFRHDFRYFFELPDEVADVDIKVGSGQWQNILQFTGNDFTGTAFADISSIAAEQSNVQVRWHYYEANYDWYWGIDDVEIWGVRTVNFTMATPVSVGELDGVLLEAGTVSINVPRDEDLVVSLSSRDETLLDVPVSVTITAGETEQLFDITIHDNDDISFSKSVTVTANADGFALVENIIRILQEDTDEDGLGDDWERYYFGSLDQIGSGDYDGDRYSNKTEYVRFTDPTDPLSYPIVSGTKSGGCMAGRSASPQGLILWGILFVLYLFMAGSLKKTLGDRNHRLYHR